MFLQLRAEDLIKIAKDNIKNLKLKGKQVGTPRVQCKTPMCVQDSTFWERFFEILLF